jgi:hypothetical protein
MRRSHWLATALLVTVPWLPQPARPASAAASGLPHGVTGEGHHYLGEAAAPVTLVEYADFL